MARQWHHVRSSSAAQPAMASDGGAPLSSLPDPQIDPLGLARLLKQKVSETKTSNANTSVATLSHASLEEHAEEHHQHLHVPRTRSEERNWLIRMGQKERYKTAELSDAEPGGEQIARWPTRFPISTIHRRYDPEDNQPYTCDEFLCHYADTQGWSQQSVWTFWQGLTPVLDHLLV